MEAVVPFKGRFQGVLRLDGSRFRVSQGKRVVVRLSGVGFKGLGWNRGLARYARVRTCGAKFPRKGAYMYVYIYIYINQPYTLNHIP